MIEKLSMIKDREVGRYLGEGRATINEVVRYPGNAEIMDKINEIIDVVNALERSAAREEEEWVSTL